MGYDIAYKRRGDQYYPLLRFQEQTNYTIGKYGNLHLGFLKAHRRGTYTTLLTQGRLNEYLYHIDCQAREQVELYTRQMAKRLGITEELKAADPMTWVGLMNGIKASAEEIVLQEVVYR